MSTYYVTAQKGDLRRDYHVRTHAHSLLLYNHILHNYPDWVPSTASLSEADAETRNRLNIWATSPFDLCAEDFDRFAKGQTVIAQMPALHPENKTRAEKTDREIQLDDFAERKALAREIFIRMIIAHPHTPGWELAEEAFDYAMAFVDQADTKDPELKD